MFYVAKLAPVKLLGHGAFGEVHLCKDPVHSLVAAKFFYRKNFISNDDWSSACDIALREAQSMKTLEHRNVVPIYHILRSAKDEAVVVVMQYCDGGSIRAFARSDCIKITSIKQLIRDAGIGLCYIHNKGFIHRDIKPDNIFCMSSGEIKIGDFGFVTDRLVFGFASGAGTPEYIAPEVLETANCSFQSDIYSLGTTFLHLIHGDFLFYRNGKHSILKEIVFNGQMWKALSDDYLLLPHIPISWRNAIKKMTHPMPAKRHKSMEEAVDSISRLPVVEDWQYSVSPEKISWMLIKGNRRVCVEWKEYFSNSDSWVAWSENLSGDRKRTLDKSDPTQSPIKRYRALQKFFSRRVP